jgi:hypothetical protein
MNDKSKADAKAKPTPPGKIAQVTKKDDTEVSDAALDKVTGGSDGGITSGNISRSNIINN